MKKVALKIMAFILFPSAVLIGCGPNDDKGGMDQENSGKEGAVDSSRLMNPDTTITNPDSSGNM